ncbi:MAG: SPOR domain-containing protein [Gammaproteobacteria bacterium]
MKSPIGRDFKRGASGGGAGRLGSRDARNAFAAGLAVGLVVAGGVFVWAQTELRRLSTAEPTRPVARAAPGARGTGASSAEADEADAQFDFYDRLKNQQVVIPEQEKDARPELPTSLIDRPGIYVLQPGAYRDPAEAEKLRARLSRLGVQATIQRVAIDADVFHRVRIGPYEDLGELNAVRARLRAADIDPQVMRIGD